MSNIVDDFSFMMWYNSIMKDRAESHCREKSRGGFCRGEEMQMPRKPKRPCSRQGCPNLCDGQYCEQHLVEERRKYDKYERSPDINKKYGHAWRRIRERYAAAHPLCEMCLGGRSAYPGAGSPPHPAGLTRRNARDGQPHEPVSVLSYQDTPRNWRPVGEIASLH